MGISLGQLQNSVLTSIYGNRLGLDINKALVGPVGIRKPVTDMTSASTGTILSGFGVYDFNVSTASTLDFQLGNPIPGLDVYIASRAASLSSGTNVKRSSTAFYIESTEGSSMTTINLSSVGYVHLMALTTDRYIVVGRNPISTAIVGSGASLNGTT